ncbi:acyltransferase family protein [Methylomonas methanica]|uniref:Acyltransferase 3 domain-containing protein n=1 Tax=Methylomonas methanica TaxID=421 RepID=A0A177MFD5_METMH|nr:acyltransferase [Methylomonas methanica]OAI04486.1 hypothetical protein A1332_01945 [Methylomonas methanica]
MVTQRQARKVDSLQAIRAFAALAVMLFHGTEMLSERLGYLFVSNVFVAGFSGVDIFFVLSGFIIFYTSSSGIDFYRFIQKRFIRIYPIYWLVTMLLVGWFFASPSPEQSYKGDLRVILGSLSLFPQKQYVMGVAWTLTYEVIFYLVFAFTYFKSPVYLFFTFLIWIAVIFSCNLFNIKSGYLAIDMLVNPIILNFALGCLIAYAYKRHSIYKNAVWFFWFGVFLFALTWAYYYYLKLADSTVFEGEMARVYLFGVPAAILIFGALHISASVPRVLVYLGDASYSLYLLHGTVLSMLIKLVIKLNCGAIFSNFSGAVFLFVCTVLISCCFYSLVERNLLRFLNGLLLRPTIAIYKI